MAFYAGHIAAVLVNPFAPWILGTGQLVKNYHIIGQRLSSPPFHKGNQRVQSFVVNGDMWYDSTANTLDARVNSATISIAGLGANTFTGTQTVTGNVVVSGKVSSTKIDSTLAAAATTLAITNDFVKVTGDAGGNTIATITGGTSGQHLTLLFVDSLVTITDTSGTTANTVNLSASFTSAANTTLVLGFDGNKWFELSRSVN